MDRRYDLVVGGKTVGVLLRDPLAVEPDREPGAGWFVVQNNGVSKGKGEWAVAAGVGDAGEGGPAVRGEVCRDREET